MKYFNRSSFVFLCIILLLDNAIAQNPIIRNMYSADPSARVFGNRVYLYPSHDILATEGKGRPGWFCMEDYHVFSSENLTDWTDHGIVVTQNKVPWVRKDSYAMWAPDCVERNGKYYFYFPAPPADTLTYGRGFTVGVAVANKPEGPFVAEPTARTISPLNSHERTAGLRLCPHAGKGWAKAEERQGHAERLFNPDSSSTTVRGNF